MKRVLAAVWIGLTLASCVSTSSGRKETAAPSRPAPPANRPLGNYRGGHLSGLTIEMSEVELSNAAPVILDGEVLSRQVVPLQDDPYLPAGWENDPALVPLVEANLTSIKWRVRVVTWIKGQEGPANVWVVRALDGARGGHGSSALPPGVFDASPNQLVHFWLTPDPWFGQAHYVLLQAKDMTIGGT